MIYDKKFVQYWSQNYSSSTFTQTFLLWNLSLYWIPTYLDLWRNILYKISSTFTYCFFCFRLLWNLTFLTILLVTYFLLEHIFIFVLTVLLIIVVVELCLEQSLIIQFLSLLSKFWDFWIAVVKNLCYSLNFSKLKTVN